MRIIHDMILHRTPGGKEGETMRHTVDHVITKKDGRLAPVKEDYLDMENHEGVRDAFKIIYYLQKTNPGFGSSRGGT